ncbi:MAG: hypothetical protein FWF12_10760 [Betaproteobacteria bacterium]|nr:hypothetical protein [Betaproteobacteria bacterium]
MRSPAFVFLVGATFLVGVLTGAYLYSSISHRPFQYVDKTIAISWGDGKNDKAFYGAQVYLVPMKNGFSVRARVIIHDSSRWHDCGELGIVETKEKAVAQWSHIDWQPEGLYIGTGENRHFTPRKRIESHR